MNFTNNSYYPASPSADPELQFVLGTLGFAYSLLTRFEERLGACSLLGGRAFGPLLCRAHLRQRILCFRLVGRARALQQFATLNRNLL